MSRVIFHVDMDAFFASVEQRDHPEYRGLPVVVGGAPGQRGVVCAASYEARKFGVRSAMPVRTAERLCPQAVFVRPRMEAYRDESERIMAILERHTPLLERVSVDEAYLDMSAACAGIAEPDAALLGLVPMAEEIRREIRESRELTASVGVAANKFLSKLGSDLKKPDGLTLIPEAGKAAFLRPLSVRRIHGVGPVTAGSLESQGLHTIGDLQDTTLPLEPLVGAFAARLRELALGIDERPIDLSRERKSVSSEHTFSNDTADRPELRLALRSLALDVEQELRNHNAGALTLQVKVRYRDFTTLTRQVRVSEPVVEASELYRLACHLLSVHKLVTSPLRLLGLGVSTLVAPDRPQLLLPF
jgi:DNA polymerase IV